MSSMTLNSQKLSHLDDERPERSRNAKAQARHRAKRKAYIEQLESTVTKLQTALGYTPDQVAALPPPLVKIRELEQENARLLAEIEDMRRVVADDPQTRNRLTHDLARRATFQDGRDCGDRDYKKRKVENMYMVSPQPQDVRAYSMNGADQHHGSDSTSRPPPPPLTIPQTMQHQYTSHSSSVNGSSASLFNMHGSSTFIPNTPSGSSSASSPPFSPAAMHPSSQSPIHHRPTPLSAHHSLSSYNHPSSNHYGSVKVEDSHYHGSHHNNGHGHSHNHHHTHPPSHYQSTTLAPFHSTPESDWSYSAERAHAHHR